MTAKQLGNECAFPTGCEGDPGLTKREYFAGQFMAALLVRGIAPKLLDGMNSEQSMEYTTTASSKLADALLAELAKEQP